MEPDSTTTKSTPQRLAQLRELKDNYRTLDKLAKSAKADHDDFQRELFEDMRAEGHLTVKLEHASFSRKSTIYAHVQDREAFHKWVKENDLDTELLRETEESQRINELVRGLIDNSEELPPGLGFYARDYISITENKSV